MSQSPNIRKQSCATKRRTRFLSGYLRRLPMIVIQQSSQARLALNLTFRAYRQRPDRSVAKGLVRTFMMIMGEAFTDQVVQMAFTKDKEIIQTFSCQVSPTSIRANTTLSPVGDQPPFK